MNETPQQRRDDYIRTCFSAFFGALITARLVDPERPPIPDEEVAARACAMADTLIFHADRTAPKSN